MFLNETEAGVGWEPIEDVAVADRPQAGIAGPLAGEVVAGDRYCLGVSWDQGFAGKLKRPALG